MQWIRRWTAVLVACLLATGSAAADAQVKAAPLSMTGSRSGTVRVYLSSLGSRTSLTIKLDGAYTAKGSQNVSLRRGDQVQVGFSTSSGQITLTVNGTAYGMGREAVLRRSGDGGLRISQARMPGNLYPGDLVLTAVKSGSAYRLYPIVQAHMEDYLTGVVPYEMGSSAPLEALKAQAVAARTYTLGRMDARKNGLYDVTDTTTDQVYNGSSSGTARCTEAVNATRGVVLMNGSALTATYYSASNGGQTEAARNVWGSGAPSYLDNREDPFDVQNPQSPVRRTTVYRDFDAAGQRSTLMALLRAKAEKAHPGASILTIDSIVPHSPKYAGGRLYTKLDFVVTASTTGGNVRLTLTCDIFGELENRLGMGINTSKNELWTVESAGANYVLCARRFGHGVGMSQRGAMQMAALGYAYDQILGFYYPDSRRVQYTFTGSAAGGEGMQAATPAPESGCYAVVRAADQTTLKAGSYAGAHTLMRLPAGTLVNVLAGGADWTLVRTGELIGYAQTAALQITGTPPKSSVEHPTAITQWAQVTGGSLNLRSGAAKTARIVTVLPDSEVLPVLEQAAGWARVQYGAAVGYAMIDYLTLLEAWPGEAPPVRTQTARVIADSGSRVRLRKAASSSAKVLTEIAVGEAVTVLEELGDWCRVAAGKTEGYMMTRFLALGAAAVPETPSPEQQDASPVSPDGAVPAFVQVAGGTVNLRAHAKDDARVLQKLPAGTDLTVTKRGAKWCAVTVGNQSGFVMTRYLVFPLDEEGAG